jgi:predicted DNA-binding transcriptional regulator AlpA
MKVQRKRKSRITARQVAEILGCATNTVYNKGAGTDHLTRIKNGPKQVRFLLDEVLALADEQERRARIKRKTGKSPVPLSR